MIKSIIRTIKHHKMFRIFCQVWIGKIGKKNYQNAKKTKKIVND